jgi:hypothetical protein
MVTIYSWLFGFMIGAILCVIGAKIDRRVAKN